VISDSELRELEGMVYNLSVRMLGSPTDAEDTTQEILLKIVRNIGSFRGESSLRTWAYRVAANHLLTTRKRAAEQRFDSLEAVGEYLGTNLAAADPPADDQVLIAEAKRACTSAMLTALDRDHRIAFILGEIFELPGEEAAEILEIEHDTYRKRVSRARARMNEFMGKTCGLVEETNACRCAKQAGHAAAAGRLSRDKITWGKCKTKPRKEIDLAALDRIERTIAVYRNQGELIAPEHLVANVRRAIEGID
jgi:RNA polymerase sigma factor (sigma-70 family)